jgi:MFS family permease
MFIPSNGGFGKMTRGKGNMKNDAYAVLKVKDFRLFLSFRFFTTVAIQMQSVIVGWQVYELTKDPLSLGLIGLAEAIPFISVALYAGHVADRFNRRNIILWFVMLFLLGTIGLLLFSVKSSGISGMYGIMPIYAVVMVSGIARAFIYPSTIALMAQVIPRSLYANSSTWNSTVWQIAAITGPAIGGLVYGFFGVKIAYMAVIFFMLLGLILLGNVKKYEVPAREKEESLFDRLASGIRFVFKNQILLASMSLDMFGVLFGGAVAMLPIFAAEILKVGPQGLGFLRAAPMLGAVIMSIVIAYRPPLGKAGRYLFLGVTGFGLSVILFALSRNFFLSLFLLALGGAFDNISVIIRSTTMQLITPDEMRGRVASVNSIFIGSSNEIGSFESGVAAKLMGLIPSVIFGGAMTLVVVTVAAWKAPLLRKLNLRKY